MSGARSGGLERFALLAGMSEADRRVLSERLEWLHLAPGALLFDEGDPGDSLLLVLEGRIRLTSARRRADGEIGAGGSIGALSLVVAGPREARGETREPCRVLRLSREGFLQLRDTAPKVACKLLEGILHESALFTRDALAHLVDRSEASQ